MTLLDSLHVEDQPPAPAWNIDYSTLRRWLALVPGTSVTVVKRSAKHHGEERARYPGIVVATTLPSPWIEIEARWTLPPHRRVHITFEPGDILREIYSPLHPFDAFALYTPDGTFKGWYANVTYPTLLEVEAEHPVIVWHDLFIDIVATPDGTVTVLDEDELDKAGVAVRDPELHYRILSALDELLKRFENRQPPFHRSNLAGDDALM